MVLTPAAPRVALITGAGSGLGQLAARRLAAAGTAVAALDLDAAGLAETAEKAPTVHPTVCDVGDPEALARVVADTEATLGPIERVVHAAAICLPGPLLTQPAADVERVLHVNYLGSLHVAQATVPPMLERGRGELVLFSSLSGWVPTPGVGAYAASKAAVIALTEVLAQENAGRGVRFVCVCPPVVDTPMIARMRQVNPRALGKQRAIPPGVVLDAVDRALRGGELFVFPDRASKLGWRARRFAPGLLRRQTARLAPRAPRSGARVESSAAE